MDNGIAPDNLSNLNDDDYRYEIYSDWRSVQKYLPNFSKEKFCRNKGISLKTLNRIVNEFILTRNDETD